MIGTAIRKLLIDNPDFAAIAGTGVYPVRVAQTKPLPAVAYQIISNTPTNCKEGSSGLDRMRVQVNIYSERYEQQEQLAAIVRQILDGYSGPLSGITDIAYQTETDLHEDAAEVYYKAQDYTITIKR